LLSSYLSHISLPVLFVGDALMKLFAVLCFVFFLSYATAQACTYSYNGDSYDLSSLKNDKTDQTVTISAMGQTVWINVCRPVLSSICSACCGTDVAACQQWDPKSQNGQASLGTVSGQQFTALSNAPAGKKGLTIQYTGGLNGRQMEIDFVCDSSAGQGAPVFTSENPVKHYNFQWSSAAACPISATSGGLDGGGIFLIILTCVAVVYCAAGFAVNWFKLQKRGVEAVPQWSFWSSIPGLTKDGVMFLVNKARGRGGNGTYQKM